VDTVVEVMGGLEPAHEYMVAAMRAGKNIVTVNKHLLAAYYDELTTLAKETGIGFRTSAAVGGGIPWLPNLQRLKRIGAVNEICGIMNGTTNYILSMMHKKGYDYESVLHDAQSFGYAEADPTADIEGYDIQRKLMISSRCRPPGLPVSPGKILPASMKWAMSASCTLPLSVSPMEQFLQW